MFEAHTPPSQKPGYSRLVYHTHRILTPARVSLLQVAEVRKVQIAGGTLQGEANPTWTKQPMDKAVNAFVKVGRELEVI